jgi:hypothetical protein
MRTTKKSIKRFLGGLPLTAELDWYLRRRGKPEPGFKIEGLDASLPEWCEQSLASRYRERQGRKVLVFGTLSYWIEHTTLLGLALAGLGHEVTLGYLPYGDWRREVSDFDLRKHNLYARRVLRRASSALEVLSLLDEREVNVLPPDLCEAIEDLSVRDTQYTLQVEEVDKQGELFKLRLKRNTSAARAAYHWMETNRPDVLIVPNGIILEFGSVFQVAQYLGIDAVTYEFGEQRDRIWFAQNTPVMLQETDALWAARKDQRLSDQQLEQVKTLFSARQGANLWQNFYRRWQNVPSEGEEQIRARLGLDHRPVFLLAANVIGDSLTLGRQTFTESMTEWLRRTLAFFAERNQVQFVLRIHPGELNLEGPSVADLTQDVLPEIPEHMRLVTADASVNTYDLVAIADLGLVYTTTVGMEMAMSGVPVIVLGRTHYRAKGFTFDPNSWDEYFSLLERAIASPEGMRPSKEQIEQAWHYAYRFFFDYPYPFPWHLLHFKEGMEQWPLKRVLSEDGLERFGETFDYLVGEPLDWTEVD